MKCACVTACTMGLLLFIPTVSSAADVPSDVQLRKKAKAIHDRIITFDSHLDLPFDYPGAGKNGKTQFDLPKALHGGLKGASFAVFVPQGPRTTEGYKKAAADAEKKLQLIKDIAEQNPDRAEIAYSPADVRRISASGKFAVVISMLNAYPLGSFPASPPGTDVDPLDLAYKRGIRILGYTHAGNNDWADSSRPSKALDDKPDEHGGLSDMGKRGVARMNKLGMLIDVSQLTTPALKQVLSLTTAPVVATHSGIRAIVDSPRNLSDEELALIKQNGGVVQVVAFGNYLRKAPEAAAEHAPVEPATVAQLVDSIAYAVKKIGIDHVGISSDFNHGGGVAGWQNEGEAQNVTVELLRRGYSERQIAKLWGGNFLRVWAQAQKGAKPTASN